MQRVIKGWRFDSHFYQRIGIKENGVVTEECILKSTDPLISSVRSTYCTMITAGLLIDQQPTPMLIIIPIDATEAIIYKKIINPDHLNWERVTASVGLDKNLYGIIFRRGVEILAVVEENGVILHPLSHKD